LSEIENEVFDEDSPMNRSVLVDGHEWTVTGNPDHDPDVLVLVREDGPVKTKYKTVRQSLTNIIWL
jgi:hypothetical protein